MTRPIDTLIDTHCHLDAAEFNADRPALLAAATMAGVGEIWVPSVAVANFQAVRDCSRQFPNCRAAYGIHPMYTTAAEEADLATLAQWLARERPFAVGEIGLDAFVPGLDWQRQLHFFSGQLKLARDLHLPVLLHVRHAVDAVLKQLRMVFGKQAADSPGGIAHAFNGSMQQAEAFLKLGFKLGFGGAATFSGSSRIHRLLRELPLDAIVLETDAPDMPPTWLRGGRNTPQQLPAIAASIAAVRQIPVAELIRATTENARALLDKGITAP